jgi:hypothetical protein
VDCGLGKRAGFEVLGSRLAVLGMGCEATAWRVRLSVASIFSGALGGGAGEIQGSFAALRMTASSLVLAVSRPNGVRTGHPAARFEGLGSRFEVLELESEATALRARRIESGGSGAGRARQASSMMVGGAPGFRRSVSSLAGKSSALQWAQWRERRK